MWWSSSTSDEDKEQGHLNAIIIRDTSSRISSIRVAFKRTILISKELRCDTTVEKKKR